VFLRILSILAVAGVISPNLAISADLTLDAAVNRAMASNPTLQAARAAISAAEQQAKLEGLRPPLTIGAELENFAGTGSLNGIDSAETTMRLGRTFELGGKREARLAVGSARVAQQQNDADIARFDLEAVTKRRFNAVLAKQARVEMTTQQLALAREIREAVAYRVRRGASPDADLPLADLGVIRAEIDLEDAEHELSSARVALSVLWAEESPAFARATGSIEDIPELPAFDALRQRVPIGADQRRFELEATLLEAQLKSVAATGKPDVSGTLGVRRLEAFDDEALVMSFSMPIGLGDRSDLARSRVQAEKAGLGERRKAAELERYSSLFSSYEELKHARHEYEALKDRMVPAAERALTLAQRGYDDARYSFLQVAQARGVLHSVHNERIAAATRYHDLLTDIERATAISGVSVP
jgi:cobalt-zinc-cadmium efflux system outer membrane protein